MVGISCHVMVRVLNLNILLKVIKNCLRVKPEHKKSLGVKIIAKYQMRF